MAALADNRTATATAMLCLAFMLVVFCTCFLIFQQHAPGPMLSQGAAPPGMLRQPPPSQQALGSQSRFYQRSPGGRTAAATSAATLRTSSTIGAADDAELPTIYPQLVVPVARTRLAVPVEPLVEPTFEIDILGASGMPLLCATLGYGVPGMGKTIQISLHSVSTLLAVVTERMQLYTADRNLFGALARGDGEHYALHDAAGRQLLALVPGGEPGEVKMVSQPGGYGQSVVERASVVRRAPGRLPREHYDIIVGPNVDAVLVLACLLALVVFALPPATPRAAASPGGTR